MEVKEGSASIFVGKREIKIPIHQELLDLVNESGESLKVTGVQFDLSRLVSGFLSRRTTTCYLQLGSMNVSFEVPAYITESLELEIVDPYSMDLISQDFGQIVRDMIPSDLRPGTERQISFAKNIAHTLGLELSDEIFKSYQLCSDFISNHIDAFNFRKGELKPYITKAYAAARGYMAVTLLIASGKEEITQEILDLLNVKQPATVEKYLQDFSSFLDTFEQLEPDIQILSVDEINKAVNQKFPDAGFRLVTVDSLCSLIASKPAD
jgi:hypothetical protein